MQGAEYVRKQARCQDNIGGSKVQGYASRGASCGLRGSRCAFRSAYLIRSRPRHRIEYCVKNLCIFITGTRATTRTISTNPDYLTRNPKPGDQKPEPLNL
jgi:hypothetical protein